MKLAGLLLAATLATTGAWAQQSQSSKPQPKAARGVDLPADAEKVRDGVWKWKDKDGKTWFYSRTPFGYSRSADDPQAGGDTTPTERYIRVTSIEGDTVRLERPTPFGGARWTKKVDDLTDEEKIAVEQYKAKPPAKKE